MQELNAKNGKILEFPDKVKETETTTTNQKQPEKKPNNKQEKKRFNIDLRTIAINVLILLMSVISLVVDYDTFQKMEFPILIYALWSTMYLTIMLLPNTVIALIPRIMVVLLTTVFNVINSSIHYQTQLTTQAMQQTEQADDLAKINSYLDNKIQSTSQNLQNVTSDNYVTDDPKYFSQKTLLRNELTTIKNTVVYKSNGEQLADGLWDNTNGCNPKSRLGRAIKKEHVKECARAKEIISNLARLENQYNSLDARSTKISLEKKALDKLKFYKSVSENLKIEDLKKIEAGTEFSISYHSAEKLPYHQKVSYHTHGTLAGTIKSMLGIEIETNKILIYFNITMSSILGVVLITLFGVLAIHNKRAKSNELSKKSRDDAANATEKAQKQAKNGDFDTTCNERAMIPSMKFDRTDSELNMVKHGKHYGKQYGKRMVNLTRRKKWDVVMSELKLDVRDGTINTKNVHLVFEKGKMALGTKTYESDSSLSKHIIAFIENYQAGDDLTTYSIRKRTGQCHSSFAKSIKQLFDKKYGDII